MIFTADLLRDATGPVSVRAWVRTIAYSPHRLRKWLHERSYGRVSKRAGKVSPADARQEDAMNRKSVLISGIATVWLAALGGLAVSAQDKYTVKVPGGLAFSEFRGYEGWQAISTSRNGRVVAMILGNPAMIDAYQAGIPGNGKPVPDGAKMAKIHWTPKPNQFFPEASVPGDLVNVDFMVKD